MPGRPTRSTRTTAAYLAAVQRRDEVASPIGRCSTT